MKIMCHLAAVLGLACLSAVFAADGLVMLKSPMPRKATLDKFEALAAVENLRKALAGLAEPAPAK